MTKSQYAASALVAFAFSIFFGLSTSIAVERDRPWPVILATLVLAIAWLTLGAAMANRARR